MWICILKECSLNFVKNLFTILARYIFFLYWNDLSTKSKFVFKDIACFEKQIYYVSQTFCLKRMGFTHCKTEQPPQSMELQEKEAQKD